MNAKEIFLKKCAMKPGRVRHTERVVSLCEELAGNFAPGKVDTRLLTEAAWLHDVAKDYNHDEHHRPEVIKAVIDGCEPDDGLDDITVIISAHKGNLFMPERYALECAILRICDKIDKMNKAQEKDSAEKIEKKTRKAKKKCNDSLTLMKYSSLLEDGDFQIISRFCADKLSKLEAIS